MLVFANTDIGKAREINQDYYYIPEQDSNLQLFILADGMGGYTGGEIASKLATLSVKEYINKEFDLIKKDAESIIDLIKRAIEKANKDIYIEGQQKEELKQMGTTLEVCLIYNNRIYIGHIGDSRIYRIRNQKINKITMDHSYVEQLVQEGKITAEEAKNHPKKNMLIKALGCSLEVEPDIFEEEFLKQDIILMCTDGLSNMLDENEIYDIINENIETAGTKLINIANKRGGHDNISVVIINNN